MGGICAMLRELVGTYQVIKGTEYLFTPPREVVGKCPRCGGDVAELQKGFFCQTESCKFAIWKNISRVPVVIYPLQSLYTLHPKQIYETPVPTADIKEEVYTVNLL